jgi:type II restriction enzyme
MNDTPAGLFGLVNSNRDFGSIDAWGKNQFNSSFPAALACYLHSRGMKANYISMSQGEFGIKPISVEDIFGINPASADIYFDFEAQYIPFQKYVIGKLPRTDLVILNKTTNQCLCGLEVKLTALPDNTTCTLSDDKFGSELVIRPDSIVYLATSVANADFFEVGKYFLSNNLTITDWSNAEEVIPHIKTIAECISLISRDISKYSKQSPFLLQPVWKTMGKSPKLADNCLDVFVWSDAAFAWFIAGLSKSEGVTNKITRQTRTCIWLYKMLLDIATQGRCDHADIIDKLSYNTKNDKAFASAGNVTNRYMRHEYLTTPRIHKDEIKNIILGGGQNLLSPERRFDAIIFNSPELFL